MVQPCPATAIDVDALMRRMTLRERIGQLNQRMLGWNAWRRTADGVATTEALDEEIETWGGIGAMYGLLRADAWSGRDWSNGADPGLSAEVVRAVQERIVTGGRHGIPALVVEEAPHGHQALGSWLEPVNLAMAASWRADLVEEEAARIAAELAARGAHLALVSGLDMLRDPRWGRAEETYGEDPLLASSLVSAMVRGFGAAEGVGVVLKHFAAQGAAIGGRNASGAPLGARELAEIHLPAARAGVEAGAVGIMAAYNDIDGVPCTANGELLTGLLRDRWGFEGIVMSDMYAIDRLRRGAVAPEVAGAIALRAGVDLSMCDVSYTALERAVERGLASEEDVDRACRRVLELKVRLGLFDVPAPAPRFPAPPTAEVAVHAASAGLVLLTDAPRALPVAPAASIAVVGPNADAAAALLGDYVPPLGGAGAPSVAEALRAGASGAVVVERGSAHLAPLPGGIDRAVAVAAGSDVVVLVLGSTGERRYGDDFEDNGAARLGAAAPVATTGEGFDVAEVRLPDAQLDLARAVAATGRPTIAVVVSGRPLGVEELADTVDALVCAFYPGPAGAEAIAALLRGTAEPVGRLPMSLPSASGSLPCAYNERVESVDRYVDAGARPRFPFGAGLSWTTWEAGALRVARDATVATVTLENTGARTGSQLVQVYGRMREPGLLPRRASLIGWTHAGPVEPGERREVTVALTPPRAAAGGLLELWVGLAGPFRDEATPLVTVPVPGAGS